MSTFTHVKCFHALRFHVDAINHLHKVTLETIPFTTGPSKNQSELVEMKAAGSCTQTHPLQMNNLKYQI